MSQNHVMHYASNDQLFGLGLNKIETMTIPAFEEITINDAIEFYQLYQYFDEQTRLKQWTDEQYNEYAKKSQQLMGLTHRYFSILNDINIVKVYETVEIIYCSAFWELFEKDKLFQRIEGNVFNELIHSKHVPIYEIFEKEKVVKKYGEVLKRYIMETEWCVDILIHYYEQDYTSAKKLYLPDELTAHEVIPLLDRYIDREKVSTNILAAIFYMSPTKLFPVTDSLRLKAKRRYAMEMEKMSESRISFESNIRISISKDQYEEKSYDENGQNCHYSYSHNWLIETLDYPSILNNFIYIFDFADDQMRASHVCVSSSAGTLEKAFRSNSSRIFPDYYFFNHINGIAMLQMEMYYQFLKENGVRLEDVLKWFYTEYLQKEFGCAEMRVSLPSEFSTIQEKCENICSAMEMVIKQFSYYATTKSIDFELLSISSGSPKFDQIPSMLHHKYIYGGLSNGLYRKIDYLLFSDQCMLRYVERIAKDHDIYQSFFELLGKEKIYKSDFHKMDYQDLNLLRGLDLIRILEDDSICLGDHMKLLVLFDLHQHDVICRLHYPDECQPLFDEWIEKNILVEESKLLTKSESDYFSFLLNHEKFSNGYDIRNKYAHGAGQIITDENEHKMNYNILLRLMVILAIKINDEFCLFSRHTNEITDSEE